MKDLLVAIDESETCKQRLAVVQGLASRFDSRVTGIHISQKSSDFHLRDFPSTQLAIEHLQNRISVEENLATETFFKSLNLSSEKIDIVSEQSASAYFELAKVNDLLVISQPSPDQDAYPDSGFVSELIMRSGRPVLLLPYAGSVNHVGKSVLIAWDDSREASRAAHEALPLLKEAESVHVVAVSERSKGLSGTPCAMISEHLARHGVNIVEHNVVKNEVPVAETLLSLSADYGSDLLVMGGYGHTRLREFVFGGVTKTILDSMTIPVLMAH